MCEEPRPAEEGASTDRSLVHFVEKRIADPRVLRLIQKWLKAGVIEDGVWSETEAGTPQGAVLSPLLSNVYLHDVLDQWTDQWRQAARGEITIVRYADDAILGFEHQHEAERYLRELKEHLREYGLELNEDMTRLIRFGRFARFNRAERGYPFLVWCLRIRMLASTPDASGRPIQGKNRMQ